MLKFCIIDDNPHIIDKLSSMLESIFAKNDFDAEVIFTTTDTNNFLSFISSNKADVFLIDIDLKSDINGIKIAEEIRKKDKDCYIIFVTAHLEYGLLAYQCKTFDFLPKPITRERLEATINRLFDDVRGVRKKFIRLDNKNTIIDENEINYIKRDGMKVVFHTNNRNYEVYSSFVKLQNQLPDNFVRCHKSFIANINNVTEVEPVSNLIHFDDCSCDIGQKYKNNFMEVIKNYGNIK
ncbi:MAG: response regulator transcription factor [Clostridia bacterium]|nr:response regulator transcription factor [Clostridia bacterium]